MNVIYLIHAEDTKRYKIGTTSNGIEKRLNELQTGKDHIKNIENKGSGLSLIVV